MSTFSSISIPRPKDWQDFERKTRVLFQDLLQDPNTQTNGRSGQRQHGVDVFGTRKATGALVGVQCKGREGDYNNQGLTTEELRAEVAKTEHFVPALREFYLLTTAPDDATIQEAARLLEAELKTAGRDLVVGVWGWNTLEQRISQSAEALRAFHPDASPFTDQLQAQGAQQIVQGTRVEAGIDVINKNVAIIVDQVGDLTKAIADGGRSGDAGEALLDDEIDNYRALINSGRPKTALDLLNALKARVGLTVSARIRFRILANIAGAHQNLGGHDEAADLFLQASTLDPGNPVGLSNRVAALLMKGRREEARQAAIAALVAHPSNPGIAGQRIQARDSTESIDELWECFPADVRTSADALFMRIIALRNSNDARWRFEAESAALLHPTERRLQLLMADARLSDAIEHDPWFLGVTAGAEPVARDLEVAATILEAAWRETERGEGQVDLTTGHNYALCLVALRRAAEAAAVCDAVLKHPGASDTTKKLRIRLLLDEQQTDRALELARGLTEDADTVLLTAELLLRQRPKQARERIAAIRSQLTDPKQAFAAAALIVQSFTKEKNWDEATKLAKQLAIDFPDDDLVLLLQYEVLVAKGDKESKSVLLTAAGRLSDATPFHTRYEVAKALEHAGLYDQAINALEGHVTPSRDSPALRLLLSAALNADKRVAFKAAIASLPPAVAGLPYYVRLQAAFAQRIGDFSQAEVLTERYLASKPASLHMRLQLFRLLVERNDLAKLTQMLTALPSPLEGDPEDFMTLALILSQYGSKAQGRELAYRTWMKNQRDPVVNLRYTGLFLGPRLQDDTPPVSEVVTNDSAFEITNEHGEARTFLVESDAGLRDLTYAVEPEHEVAKLALGKKAGDSFEVGSDRWTIRVVKPKEIHVLHTIMENFNLLFPEEDGLQRVRIDPEHPAQTPYLIESTKAKATAIEKAFAVYEQSPVPVSLIASCLKSDPVSTLLGLVHTGRKMKVCQGTQPEREQALKAIVDNNGAGCVVDEITFHLVSRFGLLEVVEKTCGPIGVVQRLLSRLRHNRDELKSRLDEPDLTIGWHDGALYKTETTVEQKRDALGYVERDIAWIEGTKAVVAADAPVDIPDSFRSAFREVGTGFADEYLAAHGQGRLLLSDDFGYRTLGMQALGLRASWLQPVLIAARDQKIIDRARYNQAVVQMIAAGLDFISVDGDVLAGQIPPEATHPLPQSFITACKALGGPNADRGSHLRAAMDALVHLWNDEDRSSLIVGAATGTLMDRILPSEPAAIAETIALMKRAALRRMQRDRFLAFADYVDGWIQGHFLVLPA